MAGTRTKPTEPKKPTQAELEKRAAERGYTLTQEEKAWYAEIGGSRYGPMASLEEVDEFLPTE